MKLFIYGAGGLGREIVDLAKRINRDERRWDEIGFIVDVGFIKERLVYDCAVFSFEETCERQQSEETECIVAIGEPIARQELYDKCKEAGFRMAKLIAPSATISESAIIGEGVIVLHNAFLGAQCQIGDNALLQPMCVLGHDCVIGANSDIGAHVGIGGNSLVESNTYVGRGAVIRARVKIGSNSIISMGAVVYNDIPDGMIVLGNPARPMRRNEDMQVFKK
jgi:sugar O-acyltransferase (sialic acid O-acetyltransferase NeuD family)